VVPDRGKREIALQGVGLIDVADRPAGLLDRRRDSGAAYAANDGVSDQVVRVNLTNGKVTPVVKGLGTTKGLVYADPSGALPSLALAVPVSGTASASATSSTSSSAPSSGSTTTSAKKKSGGSSNTGTIIGIVVVVLLILGAGGYVLSRGRGSNPR